jgi:riboflavin synthase
MFTGIIQHVGAVRAARAVGDGRRLTIDLGPLADGLAAGDSVAVDGACLTACRVAGAAADFDLAAETVARTTLGAARPGTRVNLERALLVGAALDGHLVQGHVDGTAEIARIDRRPDQWTVELAAPAAVTDEMVEKGSVTVNGVSLTLTAVGPGTFAVALIPTTWTHTTFADLAAGAQVNVETDIIGKYVRRYLCQLSGQPAPAPSAAPGGAAPAAPAGGLTIEKLREAGFI